MGKVTTLEDIPPATRDALARLATPKQLGQHMITSRECLDCTHSTLASLVTWMSKTIVIWSKLGKGHPAVYGAIALDLVVSMIVKWITSEIIDNCIFRKTAAHMRVDKRKVVAGCSHRIRAAPLSEIGGLFSPGGGRFGGAGGGSSWGEPILSTDPFTGQPTEDWVLVPASYQGWSVPDYKSPREILEGG